MEYEEQHQSNVNFLSKLTSLSLSEAIRPTTFEQYVGQDHLINPQNGAIRNFIKLGYLPSMILSGPPGIGKTTLASVISYECGLPFLELSATTMTTLDLKIIMETHNTQLVLFIDELHRLTKIQQDWLLPYIENGKIILIGATTVQPNSTRIRQAILSRCQIFKLEKLIVPEIKKVLYHAIIFQNLKRKNLYQLGNIVYKSECFDLILNRAQGDCRIAINLVELISDNFVDNINDVELLKDKLQQIFHSLNYNNSLGFGGDNYDDIMTRFMRILAQGCSRSKKIYKNPLEFVYEDFKCQNFQNHYLQQMQISDDSDVEPGDIYSEDEEDEPKKMNQLGKHIDDYQLISALFYLNLLLQRGQSPNMIFHYLIMFTIKYIECDNFTLRKLLSFKKAIGNRNNDTEWILSNCVEWLMYQKRTVDGIYLWEYISYIKTFCNKQMKLDDATSNDDDDDDEIEIEISYESDDIKMVETFPVFPDPPNSLIADFEVEYI